MKENRLFKAAAVQKEITAQNALDEALRMTDADVWASNQPSLSTLGAAKNIKFDLLSMQYQLITFLYKTYGILGKVVDVPVDDAYRYGGFDIEADTINEKEIQKLEYEIKINNDLEQLKQARKWARLFGGAALICLDGRKLNEPLKNVQDMPIEFIPVDRWQLTYDKANILETGGKWYLTSSYGNLEDYSGQEIHASRIKIMRGKRAPFIIEQMVNFWGISVYEQIFQDMNQLFKSRDVLFELLDEAKTDILKLEKLESAISNNAAMRALQKMVDFISRNKNYKSQITLSTKDEYEQKQMSFSGFEGILREIRIMMAGSANMPVNKLWGEGVTGFGSGEDSLENYNSLIEGEVRAADYDTILWMLKIRCYQLFGREVEDINIDWKPLRVLSSTDQQNIDTQKLDNIMKLFDRQLLNPQEVMEILKKEKVLIHDTEALKGKLNDQVLMNQNQFTENKDIV